MNSVNDIRIDSGPVNYFFRGYSQFVLIPVFIVGMLMYFLPNDDPGSLMLFIIICSFTLLCFFTISFHEYYSVKKKSEISVLYIRNNRLYINDRNIPTTEIKTITPLYYNPIIGKIMIYFLEIRTDREIYYFFDKPRFIWGIASSPGINMLTRKLPELQPLIGEQISIRVLPGL